MTVHPSTGRNYCVHCADIECTLADSAIPTTIAPQAVSSTVLGESDTVMLSEERLAQSSSTLKNGSMVGRYRIIKQIGRGGMGCVYKAEQASPRRLVALKVLLHGHSSNEADRLRFKREAAVVALLDHPNIVPIIESGETDSGELYYTMPLVEGVPLDTYVQEHQLPQRDILRLYSRVCAGVHAAHQRGAIHRDLKPGNILVNQAGRPQVLDFGLAKLISEPETGGVATTLEKSSAISEASIEVSRADEFLGTPAYMAPEQATRNPQDMDTRTDIYSLGVILYRLLTGVYPYQFSGTIRDIIATIRESPPIQPTTFTPSIPRDLSAILLKALAKEKKNRFQSVAEFASDLDAFLAYRPVGAHNTSTIYRTRKFVQRNSGASVLGSIASIAIVSIIIAAFFNITAARNRAERGEAEAQVARDVAESANIEALRNYANSLVAQGDSSLLLDRFADAKDSYYRAYIENHSSPHTKLRAELGLWQANRLAPPALSHTTGHDAPVLTLAFSKDRRLIASADSDGVIHVWDGLTQRRLRTLSGHEGAVFSIAISANAKFAISGDIQGLILVWDLESGRPVHALRGHRAYVTRLLFLPGDTAAISASEDGNLRIWDLHSGIPTELIETSKEGLSALAISPAGDRIVAGSKNGELIAIDSAGKELWRRPGVHPFGVVDLLVTSSQVVTCGGADKVRIFALSDGSDIATHTVKSAEILSLGQERDALLLGSRNRILRARLADMSIIDDFGIEASEEESVGFAPGGGLVYICRATGFHLYTSAPTRGLRTRSLAQRASAFAFSPDQRLLATATRGQIEVYDVATDQLLRRIPIEQRVNTLLFIDNTRLASAGSLEVEVPNRKNRLDNSIKIWQLDSATHPPLAYPAGLRRQSIKGIALSPDGSQLATASTDGSVRLWSTSDGTQTQLLSHPGGVSVNDVTFSPDGRVIAGTQAGALLRWAPAKPDLPEVLSANLDLELEVVRKLSWTADFSYLAVASGGGEVTILDAEFASVEQQFSASGSVSALAFLSGTYLVTGGRDGSTHVWDWREGRSIRDFQLHDNMIDSLTVAGGWLVTAGWDRQLQIWELPKPQRLVSLETRVHRARARLRGAPDDAGALIIMGKWHAEHGVWDAATELLAQASEGGSQVPALLRAQIHWRARQLPQATHWMAQAQAAKEIPEWYYRLCLPALQAHE